MKEKARNFLLDWQICMNNVQFNRIFVDKGDGSLMMTGVEKWGKKKKFE